MPAHQAVLASWYSPAYLCVQLGGSGCMRLDEPVATGTSNSTTHFAGPWATVSLMPQLCGLAESHEWGVLRCINT